jgi:citrate lyase subunit alpha/citrate CoA-transferase
VKTITTPGEDIDVLVTERGIAINPKRLDLLEKLSNTKLPVYSIKELYDMAHKITGVPKKIENSKDIIGYVEYRDGSIIDVLYKYN